MRSVHSLILISVVSSLCSFAVAQIDTEVFNILSLDGGGIRGLITAQVVEYLESATYLYANQTYCIPKRENEKMAMSELFQMVSGTSTGSLLTTALVLPSPTDPTKNKFWAVNASNIYKERGYQVFKTFNFPSWLRFLGTFAIAIVGGLLGYYIGTRMYHDKELEKAMESVRSIIKNKRIET